MNEDQTGSDSGKLHVSLAGPNPEHMDDEFLATAYPKVHENLNLITNERVIDNKPESHSGSMSSMKNLDDSVNFGDQFLHDKPTEDDQEKSKVREESDSTIPESSHQTVTSTPPVIAPFTEVSSSKLSLLVTPPPINTEATTITTSLPEITPFIALQLRNKRKLEETEEEISLMSWKKAKREAKEPEEGRRREPHGDIQTRLLEGRSKTNEKKRREESEQKRHYSPVDYSLIDVSSSKLLQLASIRSQVPTAVDNYLGTKLDDALLKVLERHTADLIEKYSVLPGPESVKNQESEKSPKEIIRAKKEQGEEKQDSTYSIRSTDKVDLEEFDLKTLITDEDAMDKEVADKVKDHKRKHDSDDDDEDDDDDEGPSARSNQGRSTKRRRSDSAASGSAKPPPKDDDQSSKKPRESEASASKQHPALTSTGWQITDTREAGVDSSMHRSDPESEHSEQSSDDISMQDEGNDSDIEDTDNAHIPKVSTTTWFKPIPESERPATPEPEWTIPPNDFPEPEHNWANAYATTYKVPEENKLQRKTYDIGSFIKWFCRRTGKKKLCKADLEGPAFNLVKAFHKNNVFLQYQMDECHKLLTNKVTKSEKFALSISHAQSARYLDLAIRISSTLLVDSEREYDIMSGLWPHSTVVLGGRNSIIKKHSEVYVDNWIEPYLLLDDLDTAYLNQNYTIYCTHMGNSSWGQPPPNNNEFVISCGAAQDNMNGCGMGADPLYPPPPASESESEAEAESEDEMKVEAEPRTRLFTDTQVWTGSSSSAAAAGHNPEDLTPSHIRSDLDALHRRVKHIEEEDVRADNKRLKMMLDCSENRTRDA
ncbi:hypothetical protein Tco_0522331 [Tanacetum coccineum]